MSKNKLKAIHNNFFNGFVGKIYDEEMYEDVKNGKKDWSPHIKSKMAAVTIPIEVFNRLLKMDRTITTIPFEGEAVLEGGAE